MQVGNGEDVDPQALSSVLRISSSELAATLGLSRAAVSNRARIGSPATRSRLREVTDILNRVLPWAGSPLTAYSWFRSQVLPGFGDMTAEKLVCVGRAKDVLAYLERIAIGGYA